MDYKQEKRKQLYDECASLIAILGARSKIESDEMMFLLNLLDYIMSADRNRAFMEVLGLWINGRSSDEEGNEIDEIIKATLLTVDFTDGESLDGVIATIRDLLSYSN